MAHEAPHGFVPVCASVLYETPGAIYVSIDPDVWKIRCRQCQEKTEHKCALKKLKKKFRITTEYSRMKERLSEKDDGNKGGGADKGGKEKGGPSEKAGKGGRNKISSVKVIGQSIKKPRSPTASELALLPPPPIPTNYCPCSDRPMDMAALPNTCYCSIYRPLNFSLELEVSGEFKPAYVPKEKKIKDSV